VLGRELFVGGFHRSVEGFRRHLEPVEGQLLGPLALGRHRAGDGEVERQVGPDVAARRRVESEQVGKRDASATSLIGDRRVGVSVSDDNSSPPECGKDRFVEQLHALGGEEQRLGPRLQRRSALVLQDKAVQDLAKSCLVRADRDHVVSLLAQRAGKRRDLGALAGTVKPLK